MLLGLVVWTVAAARTPVPAASVPAAEQAALLVRVLTADRNFAARGPDGPVIGVLYRRSSAASKSEAEAFAAEIGRLAASRGGAPARAALVDVPGPAALEPAVASSRADVLWVAPGAGLDAGRVAALARAAKVRTAAAVPADVEAGLAVGFEPVSGGTRIVVNLEAARAEGADFSSKLLKLARRVP